MTSRLAVLSALVALAVGCGRESGSPTSNPMTPAAPSSMMEEPAAAQPATPGGTMALQRDKGVMVTIGDACDPDTFNAAVGPGTCARAGGMKFNQFIETLTRLASVGPWHFAPTTATAQVGEEFVAVNRGGEVHTFTEVEEFGGGIVPNLNRLSHTPDVALECTTLEPDDFVAPGATYHEAVEHAGTLKFQCCIHPWMRLEAQAIAH